MKKRRGFVIHTPEEMVPLLESLGITKHAGYEEAFTRHHVDGAIPNGRTIIKINSIAADINPDGTMGKVLGSFVAPGLGFGYFVEWDTMPGHAIFVAASRITESFS